MELYKVEELIKRRDELGFINVPNKTTGFYGIYLGKDPQTGIYVTGYVTFSWDECEYYTQNVGKNKKKKFKTYEEALYYAKYGRAPYYDIVKTEKTN